MMMAFGVRTQRFMCTKLALLTGESLRAAGDAGAPWLSPPSVRFSSMYWAK